MTPEVWADYICPWCYLATDRVDYLRARHGLEVRWRPFELHPEIPEPGEPLPARFRRSPAADYLKEEFTRAGLPYRRRETWSNSRRALALSVWAEDRPEWPGLHAGLYRAYWAEGADIGDPEVLRDVAVAAGIPEPDVVGALVGRAGHGAVDDSKDAALDLAIGATPGWHLAPGVVFTGAHPREVFDRVAARLGG